MNKLFLSFISPFFRVFFPGRLNEKLTMKLQHNSKHVPIAW